MGTPSLRVKKTGRKRSLLKEAQPAATGLMLYILSVEGQATLEQFGFRPVGLPSKPAP